MTFLASLFFGVGVATWLYTQMARRTGNADPGRNFMVAGVVAVVAFIFFFTLLRFVLHIG